MSMPIIAPFDKFDVVTPASSSPPARAQPSDLVVPPTSAVVIGGLAIARVPYGRYLRFVSPLC